MPDPGIVETSTATLLAWASGAGLSARPSPPSSPSGGPSDSEPDVHVWLFALLPEQGLRPTAGLDPVRLRLRYLLTVGRDGDQAALDRLLLAAAAGPYAPVFEPVPAEVWLALAVPPRPAFFVDVAVRLDRAAPVRPRVTAPLRLETVPLRSLPGVVLGPRDVPLVGIRVETTDGTAATYTGNDGAFVLGGLPAGRATRLRLSGHGLQFHHHVTADAALPAVIRCELEEA